MPLQNGNQIRVAICVGTFRREELLRELLCGVAQLQFHKVLAPQIEIVVVDNDEYGSAAKNCRGAILPWPLKYAIEPRRGITHVRNRAIAEAGDADFIAFIDDDEVPSSRWLDELLSVQARFSADVASGPVLPRYAPDVPAWIKAGAFFEPPALTTGAERAASATNNVLIARRVFNHVGGFDDAFALSGAEDTDFFLRVVRAGYKIVWSQRAIVFETITRRRANIAWILRREYQTGNGWVFCETDGGKDMHARALRFAKACAHIAVGIGAALWASLLLNKASLLHALRRIALGAGMITALIGHRFLAYQNAGARAAADAKLA